LKGIGAESMLEESTARGAKGPFAEKPADDRPFWGGGGQAAIKKGEETIPGKRRL